jgi:hypothetical protein
MVGIRFFTTWLVYMVGICVVLVMYHGLVASIVVKASFWMVDPKVVIIIPINYHCRIAIVRLNHKSSRFILVIYIYDMCVYIYIYMICIYIYTNIVYMIHIYIYILFSILYIAHIYIAHIYIYSIYIAIQYIYIYIIYIYIDVYI